MSTQFVLPFDTETTGLPDWKAPSGAEHQPHIVQLAAAKYDVETRAIVESMNVIVRPDGWEIPQETIDVHGITMEQAMDEGIDEKTAIEQFLALWDENLRIAHNTTFDNRIIRIGTKRYFDTATQLRWKAGKFGEQWYCTMIEAQKIMGGKRPELAEAFKYFTDKDLVGAHNAMVDMLACADIYWAIQDHLKAAA